MRAGPYYLLSVLDQLRQENTIYNTRRESNNNIRIMPDERPFPGCGPIFIGVRLGTQQMDKKVLPNRSEICEVVVSITLRTNTAPVPDVGAEFYVRDDHDHHIDHQASLNHIGAHIIDLLDNRDDLLERIQTKICEQEGTTAQPATGVLRWKQSLPQPRIVDHNHFGEEAAEGSNLPSAGLLDILTFGDGERLS